MSAVPYRPPITQLLILLIQMRQLPHSLCACLCVYKCVLGLIVHIYIEGLSEKHIDSRAIDVRKFMAISMLCGVLMNADSAPYTLML